MGDAFEDFLNEMSGVASKGKKSDLDFNVFSGTDIRLASHVPFGIHTRIPQLDLSLGKPGYPAGRIVELYGFEMSGKTTGALAAIAAAQRRGGYCLWIDSEFAWDANWAITNGVDPDKVLVAEADSIEGVLNIQDKALQAKSITNDEVPFIMVVDSITAVPSMESLDKNFGEVQRIGTDAKAIRNGMRKLTKDIAEKNALAIYINHSTAKIASMPFAKNSQSAGGHALKFYSSLRIEFARKSTIHDGKGDTRTREGMEVVMTVEKNKVSSTKKPKVTSKLLNTGFDLHSNLFDAMIDIGEIEKVNDRTYYIKFTEAQISKAEWKTFVDDRTEGIEEMYTWFLRKAVEKGFIDLY